MKRMCNKSVWGKSEARMWPWIVLASQQEIWNKRQPETKREGLIVVSLFYRSNCFLI